MTRIEVLLALPLLAVIALTGCAAHEPDETASSVVADTGALREAAPTESSIRERCGSQLPPDAPVRSVRALGVGGTLVPAVVIGPESTSDTVLVLLHQVGTALCGWGSFATAAAAQGVTSILVDLCGYGDAVCTEGATGAVSAGLGLGLAEDLGARRTVLVGASMGGSETVLAVAGGAEADRWVDVSGPSTWAGIRLLTVAPRIAHRGLVVFARSDGKTEYAAAQALARRTDATFVDGGSGHGYELLTDLEGRLLRGGERLLAFAQSP